MSDFQDSRRSQNLGISLVARDNEMIANVGKRKAAVGHMKRKVNLGFRHESEIPIS